MATHVNEAPSMVNFYIFGHNISHSLSPTIHNTGFAKYGLPYRYFMHQMVSIDDDVRRIIHSPNFGGASITFPHKLAIKDELDSVSEAAALVGAVNTIVVESGEKRSLRGENTDWLAIAGIIKQAKLELNKTTTGIVIGAGGAARAAVFALQHIGIKHVVVVNRSIAKAQAMTQTFPGLLFTTLSKLSEAPAASIIVGCIPADDVTEADIPPHIFAAGGGVVVEMSYRPPTSALMKVAQEHTGWIIADGIDVLKQQAYAQFKMWTGRVAPVESIEKALAERRMA